MLNFIERLQHDIRYAWRQLASRPGFSLVALLTLALGIGATTTIYSLLHSTVLAPLPYPNAERLVRVQELTPDGMLFSASEPNFLDFRQRSRALEQIVALKQRSATLTASDEPVRIEGLAVSRGYFELLGAHPALGREFSIEEEQPGAAPGVVVLSHRLWQQRFASDPNVLEQDVRLDGQRYRVIGVMPADFSWFDSQFWLPLAADRNSRRDDHWLDLIARLAPGVSVAEAEKELAAIASDIGRQHPKVSGWSVTVAPLHDWLVGAGYRDSIYLLFSAVAMLLGIACLNLANLWFIRSHTSRGEIGIRSALGASRARILRQWLTEVFLLSSLGALLGAGLASLAIDLLKTLNPEGIPRLNALSVDGHVLAFAAGSALLTALLFGLAPALQAARTQAAETLQHEGRSGAPRGRGRLRDALAVGQIAISALLLVGAGIFLRGFFELKASDLGFDPNHVLQVDLQLGDENYAEPWQKVVFFNQLSERVAALPGVVGVGASAVEPFSGTDMVNDVTPVERAAEVGQSGYMRLRWRAVTPGFFDAAGLPLFEGRRFHREDPWDGTRNVMLSASAAAALWPGESAVGKSLFWGGTDGQPRTVIGVVGDYQDVRLGESATGVMFLPYNQLPWPSMSLLVRTHDELSNVAAELRAKIQELDPQLAVPSIRRLTDRLDSVVAGPRLRTLLLLGFATAALLLAALGVYGVMAFNFAHRRRELGLRLALGAQSSTLQRMLLRGGGRLIALGAVIGAAGAWALSRGVDNRLLQDHGDDWWIFLIALLVLGAVALTAIVIPARRVLGQSPLDALRGE